MYKPVLLRPTSCVCVCVCDSQLGELRQLEGLDGNVCEAVASEAQDLQAAGELVERPRLQVHDLITAQVPAHTHTQGLR